MTPENFKQLLANASLSTKLRNAGNPGIRPRSELQEQEADMRPKPDNPPRRKKVDGKRHPKFAVSVEVRFSDNRRRDLDGALSTVLDCLVSALKGI